MADGDPRLSEIVPGQLYLGRVQDAFQFPGVVVCVLEQRGDWPPTVVHVPILSHEDDGTVRADPHQLDQVAELARAAFEHDEPVAIVCGEGIERSGLGAAYVLHKLRHLSLPDAYLLVRERRPIVQERLDWARGSLWDTPTYRWW
jgi:hypothetical protein